MPPVAKRATQPLHDSDRSIFFVDDRTGTFHGLDLASLTGIPFQPLPIAITEVREVVSVSRAFFDAEADQLALAQM